MHKEGGLPHAAPTIHQDQRRTRPFELSGECPELQFSADEITLLHGTLTLLIHNSIYDNQDYDNVNYDNSDYHFYGERECVRSLQHGNRSEHGVSAFHPGELY